MKRDLVIAGVLFVLTSFAPMADATPLEGELGNWISDQAIPHFVELLNRHPRFKGETIRLASFSTEGPHAHRDRLSQQIGDQLTHDLLKQTHVRIPYDPQCNPEQIATVLGIQVSPGRRDYAVELVMMDIEEGLWINGTGIRWVGPLTESQRGMVASPLAVTHLRADQSHRIVDSLASGLRCRLPLHVAGLQTSPGEAPLGEALKQALADDLTYSDDAPYLLRLNRSDDLVTLQLDNRLASSTERLAEVSLMAPEVDEPLLSRITVKQGECAGNHCVTAVAAIREAAYVLAFRTEAGKVSPFRCVLSDRYRPGQLSWSFRVPEERTATGFYVLATEDRKLAEGLQRRLSRADRDCSSSAQPGTAWLNDFERLISEAETPVLWQSLHLRREKDKVEVL